MSRITLHPKHGVNPSLMICFFCQKESNRLALLGANQGKAAPRQGIYDMEPCNQCKEYMQQGIIVIGVRDGESAKIASDQAEYRSAVDALQPHRPHNVNPFIPNPYRNGLWMVLSEDWVRRCTNKPLLSQLLRRRWAFIEEKDAEALGLMEEHRLECLGLDEE